LKAGTDLLSKGLIKIIIPSIIKFLKIKNLMISPTYHPLLLKKRKDVLKKGALQQHGKQ